MRPNWWIILTALVLATGVVGAWVVLRPPPIIAPPLPENPGAMDPLIRQLIDRSVTEVQQRPRDPQAWYELGAAYHAHRLTEQAKACYEQAAALDDVEPRYLYQLARVRAFLGEYDDAIGLADRVISLADGYSPAHWRRAQWLGETGRLDEAEQSYRRALAIDPQAAVAVHGLGGLLLQRQQFEEVAMLIERHLAERPREPWMDQLLGAASIGLGRTEEGRRLMLGTQDIKPPRSDDEWGAQVARRRTGYGNITKRARALIGAGRADLAVQQLEPLMARHAEDPRVINLLASALSALGKLDDAIRLYQRSVALQPDQYTAHLNLSYRYDKRRDLAKAMDHADRAIANDPRRTEAMVQKGRLLIFVQDFAPAAEMLERAIAMGADQPQNLVTLGQVLDRLGRPLDAMGRFERALAIDPEFGSAHTGIALALASLGEPDRAWESLTRARALIPDDPFLDQAAKLIEQRTGAMPPAALSPEDANP